MMTVNPDYGKASMLGSQFPAPHSLSTPTQPNWLGFAQRKTTRINDQDVQKYMVLPFWWAFRRGRYLNSMLFSGTRGNSAIISTQNVLKMRRLDFVCPTCFIDEGI